MGEKKKRTLRVEFDRVLKLEFHLIALTYNLGIFYTLLGHAARDHPLVDDHAA